MLNKDLIWAFNPAALASDLDGPFSNEYHLSEKKLKINPDKLIDSKVWLIAIIGNESFLYGFLTPSHIERYEEGIYKDDFLLTANPFFSARFLPRHESHSSWLVPFSHLKEELRECTEEEQSLFAQLLNKNYRADFSPPPKTLLESIPKTKFEDLEHAVPDQMMLTLRAVSFGDISRSQSFPASLSAFGGIALNVLQSARPKMDVGYATNILASLDPLPPKPDAPKKTVQEIRRILSTLPPLVDTILQEIDPEKIVPRTFLSRAHESSLDWLEKTNHAEASHEKILKDVVLHLKSKDFKTYKSRSFDLFTEKAESRLLWEIKSANEQNTISQGEKGVVQLLRYATALSDDGLQDVRFLLLIQFSAHLGVLAYLSKMARRAGIEIWFYDECRDWPNRIFNLETERFPGL